MAKKKKEKTFVLEAIYKYLGIQKPSNVIIDLNLELRWQFCEKNKKQKSIKQRSKINISTKHLLKSLAKIGKTGFKPLPVQESQDLDKLLTIR